MQLIDISDDGFVTLMNEKGDTRDDMRLPEGELAQKIAEEFKKEDNTVIVSAWPVARSDWRLTLLSWSDCSQVTVMSAIGEEAIIACKNATS